MAVLLVAGAWILLAPVAAFVLSAALRLRNRVEGPGDDDAACPPAAEAEPSVGVVRA